MTSLPEELRYCGVCKVRRKQAGEGPRILIPVLLEGSRDPFYLCSHCDGDALSLAKDLEAERMSDG